jgi:GH24 family phage-related lysozyme (muramidase)
MGETKVNLEIQSDGSAKPGSADTNTTLVAVLDLKPLQIRLTDRKGKPMADEPFVVTLADEREIKGKLDLQGRAAVPCGFPKDAKVTFPRLAPSAWKKKAVTPPQKKVDGSELGLDEICADLIQQEGAVRYMYQDDHGNVTVGVGNIVPTAAYAKTLRFINGKTQQPVGPDDIANAFNAVAKMAPKQRHAAYRLHPSIELPADELIPLAKRRLTKEFLPGLRKRFSDFDSLPKPARRGLIDMVYNLGLAKFDSKFDGRHRKFGPAVRRHDWNVAAAECDVSTSRKERNEWRRAQFAHALEQEPLPLGGT